FAMRIGEGLEEPFLAVGAHAAEPALAAMPDGTFVMSWVRRDPAHDYLGDIQARTTNAEGDPLTRSTVVTLTGPSTRPHAGIRPSAAALNGSEYGVTCEDGGARRGVAFARVGMSTLPSEATDLASYLVDGFQGDVTVLRTSRGVWFAWSDASGYGDA